MRIIDADEAVRTLRRKVKDCIFNGKLQEGEEYAIAACVLNREELADELSGREINNHIQQLESQIPKWISVKERLPEVSVRLLAYEYSAALLVYDGEHMHEAYYCHATKMWHDASDEDHIIDVTHWMPLPEPPEEVEK